MLDKLAYKQKKALKAQEQQEFQDFMKLGLLKLLTDIEDPIVLTDFERSLITGAIEDVEAMLRVMQKEEADDDSL